MSKSHYSEQQRQELVTKLIAAFGKTVNKQDILNYCETHKLPNPHFIVSRKDIKQGKQYNLESFNTKMYEPSAEDSQPALAAQVLPLKQPTMNIDIASSVPIKDSTYVPFGFFKQLEQIIQSRIFYPVFITGLSGNGKTTMVEQVAAKLKRGSCYYGNASWGNFAY